MTNKQETTTHSPAPWRIETNIDSESSSAFIYSDSNHIVARMEYDAEEYDATLIAAAPDTAVERDRLKAQNAELLAALINAKEIFKHEDLHNEKNYPTSYKEICEVIVKAEGNHDCIGEKMWNNLAEKPVGVRFMNDQKWQYTKEGREFFATLVDATEKGVTFKTGWKRPDRIDNSYFIDDVEVSEGVFDLKLKEKFMDNREGIKHDDGKTRFDLLDPHGLESIAKVFTHGAVEYAPKGYLSLKKHRIEAALMRHTNLARQGVKVDEATKQSHWASVAANAMILMEMEREDGKSI